MTTALEPSLMLTAADVELMASGRPPTIRVVGYTGGMMRVPPFGDLVIDLAGLQLSGDPIPILADHDSSLRGIIGHGVARVNAGRLLVQGTLIPGSETTQRIIELNKSGFRFQASVGVAPGIIERVRAGETLHINNRTIQSPQTAFSLVRTGELREISWGTMALGRWRIEAQALWIINGRLIPGAATFQEGNHVWHENLAGGLRVGLRRLQIVW